MCELLAHNVSLHLAEAPPWCSPIADARRCTIASCPLVARTTANPQRRGYRTLIDRIRRPYNPLRVSSLHSCRRDLRLWKSQTLETHRRPEVEDCDNSVQMALCILGGLRGSMAGQDRIALNFLALREDEFFIKVYRKLIDPKAPSVVGQRRLPHDLKKVPQGPLDFGRYEVSHQPKQGFDQVDLGPWTNANITLEVLFQALLDRTKPDAIRPEVEMPDKAWKREIAFVLKRHENGLREVMWLRPYALKSIRRFGFLLNFRLRVPPECNVSVTRRQELSLTRKNGRTNENYYLDQFRKIADFQRLFIDMLKDLRLPDGTALSLESTLSTVPSYSLVPRTYVFGGGKEGRHQFFGLRDYGPFESAPKNAKLAFLFERSDRASSQDLFRALRGDTFQTFPGMEKLFHTPISRNNVVGREIDSFAYDQVSVACRVLRDEYPDAQVLPVALVPFSKHVSEEVTQNYYKAKHAVLAAGLASQFVDRSKTMGDRDAIKWSISNIALATFAKMGGVPWRVKPSTERCLIVGIGQAHRKVENSFERYVAYSVLTDSSGAYESIKVLGNSSDHEAYIAALKANLRDVLISHETNYDSFIIHATFSLRKEDIAAIKEVVEGVKLSSGSSTREFAVIKFNDHHDFFGFSAVHNSRIPYEGTVVQLSKRQFAVWFSGLGPTDSKVPRQPERPVHVDVLYPQDPVSQADVKRWLQDAMNIAGANWRGFNARSMPISIYYAKLIADHYAHFRQAGLEDLDMDDIHPWFL